MKQAVLESVPAGTEELNTEAFERGLAFAREKQKA
jgi:Pyruvate/2-oxoacid:ferredoxin oxidoreductase gamma subunit